MPLRAHRDEFARAAVIGLFSAVLVLRVDAQSTQVQVADGSGVQPLFVLDSGAAWSATWSRPTHCTAAETSADMTSGPIYLDARMSQSDAALTAQADLLASDVATELRKQLGGSETAIPDLGDKIKWYSVPAELILVARPDGSMTWRGLSASGDATAVNLLSTAMDSTRRHGSALMIWPEGYTADSIVVRLSLLPGSFHEEISARPTTLKITRFRVFTMPFPVESPALPKGELHVKYPRYSEQHRIEGRTLTQFVVDTNGKAIMSTFKDIYPKGAAPMSKEFQGYYADFIVAVREGVSAEIFTPARVGSCTVRQIVQMPILFVQPGAHRRTSQ